MTTKMGVLQFLRHALETVKKTGKHDVFAGELCDRPRATHDVEGFLQQTLFLVNPLNCTLTFSKIRHIIVVSNYNTMEESLWNRRH